MRKLQLLLFVLATCVFSTNAHAGYTHYWTWHQKPGDADLKACIDDMKRIVGARTNILAGPDGSGAVTLDASHLELNGVGADSHDPFVFPGRPGFTFCKTDGEPYDMVVTACLLVARDHFPESVLTIDSDGSWSDGDWREGTQLYSSVLGRPARNPLSSTWRVLGWPYNLWFYSFCTLLTLAALAVAYGFWKMFRKR